MKLTGTSIALTMTCLWPVAVFAQIELVPNAEPQQVFANGIRQVAVVWHNSGATMVEAEISARLLQTSAATAARQDEIFWKKLVILPGQTVLDFAPLDFPTVNAKTKFIAQWLGDTNQILGKTEVLVYPTNLLGELKSLMRDAILGALDPNNELKPVLKQNGVEFLDLETMALEDFQGKLAVIGPFHSKAQVREGRAHTIQRLARKGVAIVWIQPPTGPKDEIKPSFYVVPGGEGAVVVVQPELVADLSKNPKSQLNLVHFCKLALNPVPAALPDLSFEH